MISNNGKKERADLAALWTQAQPHVAAFVSSLVIDFHAAEDLVQQVAVAAAENFEEYDPTRGFVPWVIGIARFKVYNYFRSHRRDRHVFDSDTVAMFAEACVDLQPELDVRRSALDHCLKKLQGRSAQIVELRYIREMKPARIAQKLGISANAASVTLHRVRAALEECINQRLAEQPEPGSGQAGGDA